MSIIAYLLPWLKVVVQESTDVHFNLPSSKSTAVLVAMHSAV